MARLISTDGRFRDICCLARRSGSRRAAPQRRSGRPDDARRSRSAARRPGPRAGLHGQHHHARQRPAIRSGVASSRPGARNATWHMHTAGQLVFGEAGRGRLQIQGQPIKELGVGDSAYIPGGTFHWHGAAPNENFTMMFITMGASKTTQGEPVTDARIHTGSGAVHRTEARTLHHSSHG